MKKIIIILLMIITMTSCGIYNNKKENINDNEIKKNDNMKEIYLKINKIEYKIILEENETTKELVNYLPLELSVNELNGNEYYSYLGFELKTNPKNVKNIHTGDVMLYGDNCLVIFYKSFTTTYKYTKIGHIENTDNLEKNLKAESIMINK